MLLLDEPAPGIAQRETEALGPALLDIRDETGAALVVIEHDMPLITSISDELLALDLGSVIARGRTGRSDQPSRGARGLPRRPRGHPEGGDAGKTRNRTRRQEGGGEMTTRRLVAWMLAFGVVATATLVVAPASGAQQVGDPITVVETGWWSLRPGTPLPRARSRSPRTPAARATWPSPRWSSG